MTADEVRDGFKFRSGHLALDLPATVTGRAKATPVDLLAAPRDLDRWLVAAGLASRAPRATAADLRGAHALRESLYRLGRACIANDPFPATDLATVNRMARPAPRTPQLGRRGLRWVADGVPNLLAEVARAGAELFGGDAAGRVRACGGTGCSILFLDTSRTGDRRWCSMAACGNRAKLAAFRKRGGPGSA